MCGLVGVAGDVTLKEREMFQTMFYLNGIRGMHGCGHAMVWHNPRGYWYRINKNENPSPMYTLTQAYRTAVAETGIRVMAGHSRHATKGGITTKNNHPFDTDGFLGMHNGTIHGSFEGSNKYETDSEALFNLIKEKSEESTFIGIKAALEDTWEKSTSMAYALCIVDYENLEVSLIRNKERPLWLGYTETCVFWASEKWFIEAAAARANVVMKEIKLLPVGCLVSINLHKDVAWEEAIDFFDEYVVHPEPVTYNYGYNYNKRGSGAWGRYWNSYDKEGEKETKETKKTKSGDASVEDLNDVFDSKDSSNYVIGQNVVNPLVMESLLAKGCVMCQQSPYDPEEVRFIGHMRDGFVCSECADYAASMAGIHWNQCIPVTKMVN